MIRNGYTEPNILVEEDTSLSSKRTRIALAALLVILIMGAVCAAGLDKLTPTFRGNVDVYALQQNPEAYDDSVADGAAAAIVQQNLAKSNALNDVTSIVFDFRGYDTMGEAFILCTAVAGSIVILYAKKTGKEEDQDE